MPNHDEKAIETKGLMLSYPNINIMSNVTLEILKGEFIGILGPNGSGKSTFLRALLGLIKPAKGQLKVLGKVPKKGCLKIGYMPQMRHIFSVANLSSREMLEASINGTSYGLPLVNKKKKIRVDEVLEMVNARAYADRPLQQLSGGERQRIYLAQALLDHPSMLLLDEPLSNLDPHYQKIFIKLLHQIKKNLNVTVLLTAHDPNPLLHVINRVLYFASGKSAIGPIDEIITSHTLSALYGTAIEVIKLQDRLFVLGENQLIYDQDLHYHV